MKEEIRIRMVPQKYTVFISEVDGKEFCDRDDCIAHEEIAKGHAKLCPDCNGKKFRDYEDHEFDPMWHPGEGYRSIVTKKYGKCPTCKGKGYLKKKVTWE